MAFWIEEGEVAQTAGNYGLVSRETNAHAPGAPAGSSPPRGGARRALLATRAIKTPECKSKTRENKDPPRAGDSCCLHAQAANGGSGSACPWACEPRVGVGTGLGPRPRAPSPARRSARVKRGRRRDPVSAQCSGESGAHGGLTGTAPRVCVSGCAAPRPAQRGGGPFWKGGGTVGLFGLVRAA